MPIQNDKYETHNCIIIIQLHYFFFIAAVAAFAPSIAIVE